MTNEKRSIIDATIDALCERFPRAFFRKGAKRRPLKLGFHIDLAAALKGEINSRDVRAALKMYTASPWYRRALTVGAVRIDLNGDPAGEVSPAHAAFAQRMLSKQPPAPSPKPAATGPVRDGLSALKAAAALRRQQQTTTTLTG
jgi:ProP effector